MYIDPCLFTMGVMGLQRSIENATTNHTYCDTHTTNITNEVNVEELARAIVEEQERSEKVRKEAKEWCEKDIRHQLGLYAIKHCGEAWIECIYEKITNLFSLLETDKPLLDSFSASASRLRIYPSSGNCKDYVRIGKFRVEAYVFQIYMEYFSVSRTNVRNFWREGVDGNIYFVIKNEFAEELGWK